MKVAHLLRKYNPVEWGGTETALHGLCGGLQHHGVASVVYCPRLAQPGGGRDPLAEAGCTLKRFNACVPIWGIPRAEKQQMIAVGGNLFSFELIRQLWNEPELSVVHSHALGRIGGIGRVVARQRGVPFLVTIHGGVYDLPEKLKASLNSPEVAGWEWGKLFGAILRTRRLLSDVDAIVTCNPREAALIRERHPGIPVLVQPHGVPADTYARDQRTAAREAFPQIAGRTVMLTIGRLDGVKNQSWLVEQVPELVRRHPNLLLVLAGACTDAGYEEALRRQVARAGAGAHVLLTGGLPPGDPRLIGLLQEAKVVVMPSISETFGLIILEAWAAGTPVVSSRTSGAGALIEHGRTGFLFDLNAPAGFHRAVDQVLDGPDCAAGFSAAGRKRVLADYDTRVLAGRMKQLYEQLIDSRHALRPCA